MFDANLKLQLDKFGSFKFKFWKLKKVGGRPDRQQLGKLFKPPAVASAVDSPKKTEIVRPKRVIPKKT
jgi:hypothetical protein